jgi:hypothetical protein
VESEELIELDTPVRAEDAAFVPLKIKAKIPQTRERYIKTITLIIDKNPSPVAGTFHFTPQSGRADLAMRIRVNEYSPVRAIAETSDGRFYDVQPVHQGQRRVFSPGGHQPGRGHGEAGQDEAEHQAAGPCRPAWPSATRT